MAIFVQSRLSRSAFSGERVFHLATTPEEYIGLAPLGTCYDAEKTPLPPEQPTSDSVLSGFVSARVLSNGGEMALILAPDGEKVEIPQDLIADG